MPEKRDELTTEGGLDVLTHFAAVEHAVRKLQEHGIRVSLFIDADKAQIEASHKAGATVIELHTGVYADAQDSAQQQAELERLRQAAAYGVSLGLRVNAGHGLHYENVQAVAAIPGIAELNIGHAIVAQSVFDGWEKAVRDMKALIRTAC